MGLVIPKSVGQLLHYWMVSNGLQFSENKLVRRLGQRYNSRDAGDCGRSEKGEPDSREMAYSQIDKNSIMI